MISSHLCTTPSFLFIISPNLSWAVKPVGEYLFGHGETEMQRG